MAWREIRGCLFLSVELISRPIVAALPRSGDTSRRTASGRDHPYGRRNQLILIDTSQHQTSANFFDAYFLDPAGPATAHPA